ncbi:hypothetical protein [Aliikangiella coralliicola]|uniref:Uncharacterized protein n=1 Tax=Aliikangiella coralliicola TaxID=2592383 RepID=A0A545UCQ1_9GAMM|nr:hypothetical protein [Aliikangiella coralliicola]TQV87240.1 hypothetical protein FLL46_12355 [Aliikangiella coralliicola]
MSLINSYSQKELRELLENIGRDVWLDGITKVETLLNEPNNRGKLEISGENVELPTKEFKKLILGVYVLVIVVVIVFTGLLVVVNGYGTVDSVEFESIPARISVGLIIIWLGYLTFQRSSLKEKLNTQRKKRAS